MNNNMSSGKISVAKDTKPTKEQFEEYVAIRDEGITNMFDLGYITQYSETGLNKGICIYIMKHFRELAEEYEVEV